MSAARAMIVVVQDLIPPAEMLDFEDAHRRHTGWKQEEIRARFGVTPASYYQLLSRAIDTLQAQQLRPLTVKRLRRIRDQKEAERRRRLGVA